MYLSISLKTLYERVSQLVINPYKDGAILLKFLLIILKIISSLICADILGNFILFQKNYNQRIKDNIKTIKKLPKIKGVKEIMYPGQNKFNRYKQNFKKEILIPDVIKKDLELLVN